MIYKTTEETGAHNLFESKVGAFLPVGTLVRLGLRIGIGYEMCEQAVKLKMLNSLKVDNQDS